MFFSVIVIYPNDALQCCQKLKKLTLVVDNIKLKTSIAIV